MNILTNLSNTNKIWYKITNNYIFDICSYVSENINYLCIYFGNSITYYNTIKIPINDKNIKLLGDYINRHINDFKSNKIIYEVFQINTDMGNIGFGINTEKKEIYFISKTYNINIPVNETDLNQICHGLLSDIKNNTVPVIYIN